MQGAADIFYSMGRWDLRDDEALIMTGTLPAGPFANVMLWNVHMQTLDYRNLPTALNKAQIEYEPDGSYRIIISHRDQGCRTGSALMGIGVRSSGAFFCPRPTLRSPSARS